MEKLENSVTSWTVCQNCKGQGKKNRKQPKNPFVEQESIVSKNEQISCKKCLGSGLIASTNFPQIDAENYPNIAIIGSGIGGVALAVACLHRGIPFTLFERDKSFSDRSQGYGLTLQQASKAMKSFGIKSLKEGIVSSKHIVHTTEGNIIGEWGMRKWMPSDTKKSQKQTNIHISRQSLRLALLEQLGGHNSVQWGHQLLDFKESDTKIDLSFQVNGEIKNVQTDILVGADGIRSSVRKLLLGEEILPLRYLDCMVILGICSLKSIKNIESSLLDGATVFQTANGKERIYMMPYSEEALMWQLSFPISEEAAKEISTKGKNSLKEEAIQRTNWHSPIPEIIKATLESQISGYPVYDREILSTTLLEKTEKNITLIGDAAHPMSPFKGQGANQALLDALSFAREITKKCTKSSNWKEIEIRKSVLNDFESEMLSRSASKVIDSAEAAKFLHSEIALFEGNQPRGSVFKKLDN
ncbi:FAD-dependent monooxygenase [Flavobacterium sp.]|uniref:FAD-dependent monooxygenase n=1 Tax=Flavobacterium sp. TaxID=239 RepID=UPI0037C11D13